MNYKRPYLQPLPTVSLAVRRHALPRQGFALPLPRRDEPCQHQATAEYQAARLSKLLRSQPSQAQSETANALLQELVEAYRLALHKARQG
ncbi:hypothetical protein DFO61_2294 [Ectopseudomonas oleovorans]|uniref:Uncharacterized protein n=1 Tax=Ectopseudomonas oleovorans TaxID=301 RepID=A0A397N2C2_ECTOL|nr:hypothetical protein [Pseudomonas oleovorans]RIA31572.1 hypothetical protein DFO61_2294 [Pseudomonas oleovorans]